MTTAGRSSTVVRRLTYPSEPSALRSFDHPRLATRRDVVGVPTRIVPGPCSSSPYQTFCDGTRTRRPWQGSVYRSRSARQLRVASVRGSGQSAIAADLTEQESPRENPSLARMSVLAPSRSASARAGQCAVPDALRRCQASRRPSSRSPAATRVSVRLAKWNRTRFRTGSRKKLDPGTAATPICAIIHSQNARSSAKPDSAMSTRT